MRWSTRGDNYGAGFEPRSAADSPSSPTSLEEYFDAHLEGPGIWKWRHYFPAYAEHLAPFVGRPVRVLEIGVYSGGSLGMWRAYLGEQAHIVGLDIEPSCRVYAGPGIEVVIGDQSDPAFWERFLAEQEPFDIVIDDGGHETYQQVATLEAVLPAMNPGGVYVCEDMHGERNGFVDYTTDLLRHLHAMRHATQGHEDGLNVKPTPFQEAVESAHIYPYITFIVRRLHRLERLVAPKHGTVWEPFLGGAPTKSPGQDAS